MKIIQYEGSELIGRSKTVEIDTDKLKLDPENVRFQHIAKKMSDREIEALIWKEQDTAELYRQILGAKGIYQELIVDSEMTVKEGNRRLVCLRKLKDEAHKNQLPGIPAKTFDKTKTTILPKDAQERDIDLLLATIHVKGKKPWNTFNRAKHIFNLHNIHGISYDNIARILGMGKVTVIRNVDVYNATQTYGKRYPEDKEWFRKFTYFEELYKRKDLKDFRANIKNVDKFSEWVKNNKFHDVRDVRSLARVLADSEALEKLERHGFADAQKIIESKDPTVTSAEFRKIKDTVEIIRSFPRKELMKTLNDSSRMSLLKLLRKEVQDLLKDLEAMSKK